MEVGGVEEAGMLARAASGDRSAQLELAHICVSPEYLEATGISPFEAYVGAEMFARLAVAQGGVEEAVFLAGVLRVRSSHVAQCGDAARAVALLLQSEDWLDACSKLTLSPSLHFLVAVLTDEANAGCEVAAERLNKIIGGLSPADANKLRDINNEAEAFRDALEEAR